MNPFLGRGPGDALVRHYPEVQFGGFTDSDGTIAFYNRVRALMRHEATVIDVGCGCGTWCKDAVSYRRALRWLRHEAYRVVGLDVDPNAAKNPSLSEFRLIAGTAWPVEDRMADLLVADCVLEHVEEPDQFFSEARRVLRPNGYFCFRTTNKHGYIGVAASLTPLSIHLRALRRLQPTRAAEDVFKTYYRANTISELRRLLDEHGFDGCVYGYESEPNYIPPSWACLYRLAQWSARRTPRTLRTTLFGFARVRRG